MQRASTQLSINLHQNQQQPPMKGGNLNKKFGSSQDIKMQEYKSLDRRQEKAREIKKAKAPPPPTNIINRSKMTPPPTQQAPEPPLKAKTKLPMGQRLFGDTLPKKTQNITKIQSQINTRAPVNVTKPKEKPMLVNASNKLTPAPAKLSPVTKVNPISYLRRERTFDLSLMQTPNKEKFKPKFSPQFQRKIPSEMVQLRHQLPLPMLERNRVNPGFRASISSNFNSELQNVTNKRRSMVVTNSERMRTIDKPFKKPAPIPAPVKEPIKAIQKMPIKAPLESKKSSENSAISNPTLSASSSFKYTKPKLLASYEMKKPEFDKFPNEEDLIKEALAKDEAQLNNFYFGMNEASVDTDDDENAADQEQMEAINRFAEDIFKMGSTYVPQSQGKSLSPLSNDEINNIFSYFVVSSESLLSDGEGDSDSSDILLNLRPTLPRKQLQIPRFSPVAAWRSLLVETNLSESKSNGKVNGSSLHLHLSTEEAKNEIKIEKIYREPSFNLLSQQLDNKSGDSGISAGDIGNTPDSNLPPAYLMSSWTPQQDLEEDEEEEHAGNDKHTSLSRKASDTDKSQSFLNSGHMFSLSLPRDSHTSSDKTPQNNFYSLQKFRKTVADVFGSITSVNDNKVQIHNYGVDSNWVLSSQPNSIDEFSPKKDTDTRNQIISQMTSGKHVMYLPTNMNDEKEYKYESNINEATTKREEQHDVIPTYKDEEDSFLKKIKIKNHRFKFQSTIRQVERRKIADKLSKEAEEAERDRFSELEAMQKVEEEFQRKRAREKASIRHQLRIVSLEESLGAPQNYKSNNFR